MPEISNILKPNMRYTSVRIIECSDPNYWYADKVGEIIRVRKNSDAQWGYECDNGFQVHIHDVDITGED